LLLSGAIPKISITMIINSLSRTVLAAACATPGLLDKEFFQET